MTCSFSIVNFSAVVQHCRIYFLLTMIYKKKNVIATIIMVMMSDDSSICPFQK